MSCIELLDSVERFQACAHDWDEIYARDPDATVFLSYRWMDDLHRRREGVCVLAWCDDTGRYRAFLPLRRRARANRRKRRFDNVIGMAGNDWADHNGVLCSPEHELIALPALGAALAALDWRRLDLEYLRIAPARLALLMTAFDDSTYSVRSLSMDGDDGDTSLAVSPSLALPATFDSWLDEHLSASARQRVRRFRRHLDAADNLTIRLTSPASRERDLDALRTLWLARWESLKGRKANARADTYRRIVADGLASDHLRLVVMEQAGNAVALHASYIDPVHRVLSFFVGARDVAFDALPAGLLLHAHEIEWAIEAGYCRYDLLRGDEPYKYSLGAVDESVMSLEIRPSTLEPERVFLHPHCRDEALSTLSSEHAHARASTIERLYGQLLESWPGDRVVLEHYAQWLGQQGDRLSADTIAVELAS